MYAHCGQRFDEGLPVGAERRLHRVILLTATMMAVEVAAGAFYRSMALLADGWHMGTHVAAIGIAAFAYRYARRHAEDPRYSFGTGKIGVLGGFASAVALAVVALMMALESLARFVAPRPIRFDEALLVAVVGLLVNLASAFLLGGAGEAGAEATARPRAEHDHNLRAAYLHVLADALTSVLAILALTCGKFLGWVWMDPLMGLVGAAVIGRWSCGLLRDTSRILLDRNADEATVAAVRRALEGEAGSTVADLHVWHIAPHRLAAIVTVETDRPLSAAHFQRALATVIPMSHVTVEVKSRPQAFGPEG